MPPGRGVLPDERGLVMELHELINMELDLRRLEFERSAPPKHVRTDHAVRNLLEQRGLDAAVHVLTPLHLSYQICPIPPHLRRVRNERIVDFDGTVTLNKQVGRHGYNYMHADCTGSYVIIGFDLEDETEIEHHPVAAVYATPEVDLVELAAALDRTSGQLFQHAC